MPNRKHIVVTKNKKWKYDNPQVEIVYGIEDLKKYIDSEEENFVIGGESIYSLLMPYVNKMYVTKINENFDGDTYFPEINEKNWKIIEKKEMQKDEKNPYQYEFLTYVRK